MSLPQREYCKTGKDTKYCITKQRHMLITGITYTATLANSEEMVKMPQNASFHLGLHCLTFRRSIWSEVHSNFEILTNDRLICKMMNPRPDGNVH